MTKKWLYILSPFRILALTFIFIAFKILGEKESNNDTVKCGLSSPAFIVMILSIFILVLISIDFLARNILSKEKDSGYSLQNQ